MKVALSRVAVAATLTFGLSVSKGQEAQPKPGAQPMPMTSGQPMPMPGGQPMPMNPMPMNPMPMNPMPMNPMAMPPSGPVTGVVTGNCNAGVTMPGTTYTPGTAYTPGASCCNPCPPTCYPGMPSMPSMPSTPTPDFTPAMPATPSFTPSMPITPGGDLAILSGGDAGGSRPTVLPSGGGGSSMTPQIPNGDTGLMAGGDAGGVRSYGASPFVRPGAPVGPGAVTTACPCPPQRQGLFHGCLKNLLSCHKNKGCK